MDEKNTPNDAEDGRHTAPGENSGMHPESSTQDFPSPDPSNHTSELPRHDADDVVAPAEAAALASGSGATIATDGTVPVSGVPHTQQRNDTMVKAGEVDTSGNDSHSVENASRSNAVHESKHVGFSTTPVTITSTKTAESSPMRHDTSARLDKVDRRDDTEVLLRALQVLQELRKVFEEAREEVLVQLPILVEEVLQEILEENGFLPSETLTEANREDPQKATTLKIRGDHGKGVDTMEDSSDSDTEISPAASLGSGSSSLEAAVSPFREPRLYTSQVSVPTHRERADSKSRKIEAESPSSPRTRKRVAGTNKHQPKWEHRSSSRAPMRSKKRSVSTSNQERPAITIRRRKRARSPSSDHTLSGEPPIKASESTRLLRVRSTKNASSATAGQGTKRSAPATRTERSSRSSSPPRAKLRERAGKITHNVNMPHVRQSTSSGDSDSDVAGEALPRERKRARPKTKQKVSTPHVTRGMGKTEYSGRWAVKGKVAAAVATDATPRKSRKAEAGPPTAHRPKTVRKETKRVASSFSTSSSLPGTSQRKTKMSKGVLKIAPERAPSKSRSAASVSTRTTESGRKHRSNPAKRTATSAESTTKGSRRRVYQGQYQKDTERNTPSRERGSRKASSKTIAASAQQTGETVPAALPSEVHGASGLSSSTVLPLGASDASENSSLSPDQEPEEDKVTSDEELAYSTGPRLFSEAESDTSSEEEATQRKRND